MSAEDTRTKLLGAAVTTLRGQGIAGLSARAIATEAGVNQALVFYHFGTVDGLVGDAVRAIGDSSVGFYRERFADVGSLGELLELGRVLHDREQHAGNVQVMAQLFAAGQTNETLAAATRDVFQLWVDEIGTVLHRVLAQSALAGLIDVPGLARAVSASFIGLELYLGVDGEGGEAAMASLAALGGLADVLDDLGPVERRAVRSKLRRAVTKGGRAGTRRA